MSNVEGLLKAIDRDPDDLTAVAALTDALMEERDMLHTEAEKYAERALQAARDVRDIAAAAALMTLDHPFHVELLVEIFETCGLPAGTEASILIATGEEPPRYHCEPRKTAEGYWSTLTIVVGARWLTALVRGKIAWRRAMHEHFASLITNKRAKK